MFKLFKKNANIDNPIDLPIDKPVKKKRKSNKSIDKPIDKPVKRKKTKQVDNQVISITSNDKPNKGKKIIGNWIINDYCTRVKNIVSLGIKEKRKLVKDKEYKRKEYKRKEKIKYKIVNNTLVNAKKNDVGPNIINIHYN